MESRKLTGTDVTVSAVTMGCWAIVGDETWGPQDESDAIAAIHEALDCGVNTFDTAEGYGGGYSEEILGRALSAHREEVVVLSKVSSGHLSAPEVKAACEASLKRLQRDHIDLYQIHWPSRSVPFEETYGALLELKASGKVRAIGVSNFGVEDLGSILDCGDVASDQMAYNLLFRALEYEIQPLAIQRGVSILCYSPLMQGLLTGKFAGADDVPESRARTRHFSSQRPQASHGEAGCEEALFDAVAAVRAISDELGRPSEQVALAWLLTRGGVAGVIAGARSPSQIRANAAAAQLELSADVVERLSQATEAVKIALGENADMWLSPSRIR